MMRMMLEPRLLFSQGMDPYGVSRLTRTADRRAAHPSEVDKDAVNLAYVGIIAPARNALCGVT